MKIYPGQIVKAIAGRDKDKYFVVLSAVDSEYCLIADGRTRKVDAPKKKKLKHLKITEHLALNVKEKLSTDKSVTNSLIKDELRAVINIEGC